MLTVDWTALTWLTVLAALATPFYFLSLRKKRYGTYLNHSVVSAAAFTQLGQSARVRFSWLPKVLVALTAVFAALAFIRPALLLELMPEPTESPLTAQETPEQLEVPTEGAALYLVCDVSSSMQEKMRVETERGIKTSTRLDVLKARAAEFIRARPTDMLGLVAFARVPRVLSPLTLDQKALLDELGDLKCVVAQEDDGTAIGYALYKTAHLIEATRHYAKDLSGSKHSSYNIKTAAIILVTDGFSCPNPLDAENKMRCTSMEAAAQFAKDAGVRIYIINVEPLIRHPQYAKEASDLEAAATATGGRFFVVENGSALGAVYSEIDRLEKSLLPQGRLAEVEVQERQTSSPDSQKIHLDLYPYLVALSLFSLSLFVILSTTLFRRIV